MRKTIIATALVLVTALGTPIAYAQDNPFMVRLRAVNLDWDNGRKDGLPAIAAKDKVIPEVDISYFFTPNIAAELVLTYPQKVDISLDGATIGNVKALPPSLLLQYHFTQFGQFKPYIGAGVNYTLFSKRNNLLSGAAAVERSSFGYALQAGFDYMLDKHWGINVDLKYAKIETDVNVVGAGKIGKLDLSPTMLGVGVTYKY
jgi:outer membrane protein